jgi:uncharacterized protein YbjT (DUF2867 family)
MRGGVVVTGANGQVGRALLARLAQKGVPATAIVRRQADLPAARLVAGGLGSPAAAAAVREAAVVVHLAGALRPGRGNYRAANVEPARAVAGALAGSGARRALFMSCVGADPLSPNAYLRAKGEAEAILGGAGIELVVFRSTHIIGSPSAPGPTAQALLARPAQPVKVLGTGRQRLAPVFLGDVVAALESGMADGAPGVYELAGPEQMTMDALVRLLNRDPQVPISHVPRWLALALAAILPSLPRAMVEVLLADSLGDPSRAVAAFGLKLASIRTIWR